MYGSLLNSNVLDITALNRHVEHAGKLEGYLGAQPISNAFLLCLPWDVLIPAAPEGTINCDNDAVIQAKLIVEAANMPATHIASAKLQGRGTKVSPK